MADLANVESELAQRTTGMPNQAAQRGLILIVTTGWRSLDEQWRFYNDMVVAKQKYGRRWQQQHAALAAYPGTSDQGKTPATAVDLACASPTKQNIKTQQAPASRSTQGPHTPASRRGRLVLARNGTDHLSSTVERGQFRLTFGLRRSVRGMTS